jgi:hypothetical protein
MSILCDHVHQQGSYFMDRLDSSSFEFAANVCLPTLEVIAKGTGMTIAQVVKGL